MTYAEMLDDRRLSLEETRLRSLARRAGVGLSRGAVTGGYVVVSGQGISLTRGAVSLEDAIRFVRLMVGEV
jgi:hypothetical protein